MSAYEKDLAIIEAATDCLPFVLHEAPQEYKDFLNRFNVNKCRELVTSLRSYEEENQRKDERIAELEANNARLREAAVEACGWNDSAYADDGALHDIRALEKVLAEAPADSLAAVRREAMEKMREKIAGALIDAGMPRLSPTEIAQVIREVKADA